MPGPSPTVRRRRLAVELRALREKSGLTIEQVAERMEVSSSKISRIETARVAPRREMTLLLCGSSWMRPCSSEWLAAPRSSERSSSIWWRQPLFLA